MTTPAPETPRLLVIDGNAEDRRRYRELLNGERVEWQIEEVESPFVGLERAARLRPACILLDFDIPHMNGVQFVTEFRRCIDSIAVIMLTRREDAETSVAALKSGADDYLIKRRLTADLLRLAIRGAVRRHALRSVALRQQQRIALLHALLDQSDDLLLIVDLATQKLAEASSGGLARLGFRKEALVGQDLRESGLFVTPEAAEAFLETARAATAPFEWEFRMAHGRRLTAEVRCHAIEGAPGQGPFLAAVGRDVSQRKQLEKQLRQLSYTDGLTGVSNRLGFDQYLREQWTCALGEGVSLALLLIDVDHFKTYNDRLGHQIGDEVLCTVAGVLSDSLPSLDHMVARYGGDEFAVLMPATAGDVAIATAARMLDAIRALPALDPGAELRITATIGVAALVPTAAAVPEALVAKADAALYRGKKDGRNCVAGGDA